MKETEIIQALHKIKTTVFEYEFSNDVNELYKINYNIKENIESTSIPNAASFADKNKDVFLAKIRYKTVVKRVPKPGNLHRAFSIDRFFEPRNENDYIDKEFTEPYSYEHLLGNLPFFSIEADLVSKLPNLSSFTCSMAYLLTPV